MYYQYEEELWYIMLLWLIGTQTVR
jgi:hypothetical protein